MKRALTFILFLAAVPLASVAGAAWLPLPDGARALMFHSLLVDQGPAPTVAPGATVSYTVHFRNIGITPWHRGTNAQVNLGVRGELTKFAELGMSVGWPAPTRVATTAEDLVLPGGVGTFTFSVRAPAQPGVYRIPLRPVVEGLTWLEDGGATLVLTSDLGFHSALVDQTSHSVLKPSEMSAPISVRIRNTGARTWTKGVLGQQVNLGVAGDDRTLSAIGVGWPAPDRVAIQTEPTVFPGGVATFTFRIRAPSTPGIYPIRLRPVVDGLTWMEDEGIVSLVIVDAPASASAPTEAASGQAAPLKPTKTPSFSVGATVDPTSVAAGGTATINATFTAVSASTVVLGVEIHAPGGATLAFQKWFQSETFAAGEQRSYHVAWVVPSAATVGTYGVTASVYADGWKALYGSSSSSFAVSSASGSAPVPTAPASTAPTAAPTANAPAATPPPTASLPAASDTPPAATATTQPTAAPTAAPVATPTTQPTAAPTSAPAATPTTQPTAAPTAPTSAPTTAPTPSPGAPRFSSNAVASPTSVVTGSSVSVNASVTAVSAVNALVDIEIYAPGATAPAYQVWFDNQQFAAGQQRSFPATWAVPSSAAVGAYVVKVGVFAPAWVSLYDFNESAGSFSVQAATPTPAPTPSPTSAPTPTPVPSPTQSAATGFTSTAQITPATVNAGSTVTVTALITSNAASNTLIDVEIYGPASTTTPVYQTWFDQQAFTAGQQRTYPVTWSVPAGSTSGSYRVALGVFSPAWVTLYNFNTSAGTFTVNGVAPTPVPTPLPPAGFSALHVQGNHLVNASGQTVQLHGVNRSGSEYMCVGGPSVFDGPSDQASITAMKSWHVNAVRIPMNEDCWLAINGVGASGATYQNALKNYVNLLIQNGIYPVLELHWSAPGSQRATGQNPMPDMDHTPTFWSQVASTFKGNDFVILELFNEPYPDSTSDTIAGWTCWRDGGTCAGIGYQVAGMQTLVNSVRATGATNVIAIGGLAWSNFLSRWLQYRPTDPQNNVAAVWHVYNFALCNSAACYDGAVAAVAAQVPIITTEVGDDSCGAAFMNMTLNWMDAHQLSYLAWTWDTWGTACSSIALISDYAGTATTYGAIVKAHLISLP